MKQVLQGFYFAVQKKKLRQLNKAKKKISKQPKNAGVKKIPAD